MFTYFNYLPARGQHVVVDPCRYERQGRPSHNQHRQDVTNIVPYDTWQSSRLTTTISRRFCFLACPLGKIPTTFGFTYQRDDGLENEYSALLEPTPPG